MQNTQLNLTDVIIYNNSEEYRQCIRTFFQMDTEKVAQSGNLDGLDGEDLDEQLYDPDAISSGFDHIYSITKIYPAFVELYRLAAGLMFSENPEIGLSVLFSYDYFATFSKCLVERLQQNGDGIDEGLEEGALRPQNDWYMILYNNLSK